ncbi:MAG: PAS domain S-box protein [Solirubrobacteraceae bacterium]
MLTPFDTSLIGMALISPDGAWERVNPALCSMLGRSEEQLLGCAFEDVSHPKDGAAEWRRMLELAPEEGATYQSETRMVHSDGHLIDVLLNVVAVAGPDGTVARYFHQSIDVTGRRSAERALGDSERRFRSVARSINDALISADADGNVLFWNEAAAAMFGRTPDQMLGQPLTSIMPERYRELHESGLARYRRTREPHVIGKTVQLHGLRRDGSEFPLSLSLGASGAASSDADETVFYTGVIRDLSEHERIETRRDVAFATVAVLAGAEDRATAIDSFLESVARPLGWAVASLWTPREGGDRELRCRGVWSTEELRESEFVALTREGCFAFGEGLPGRVWQAHAPVLLADVGSDRLLPRARAAAAARIGAGAALPVPGRDGPLGVLEVFRADGARAQPETVAVLGGLAVLLGLALRCFDAEGEPWA